MYVHFVDFERAFDSVHRSSLWTIMKTNDILDKIINIVKAMYENFKCAVLDECELTDWFRITSGVLKARMRYV